MKRRAKKAPQRKRAKRESPNPDPLEDCAICFEKIEIRGSLDRCSHVFCYGESFGLRGVLFAFRRLYSSMVEDQ